ncbi:MAG: CDP-alcohol phosphatidyltransferase family protein [Chitinophagaceae bacterium]|nr:CDP-alcohol phosphatidyltransferase family protein [Chitinophagaceae bacterium]MCB9047468.1 CDP-alcohol phosphatidyltransferase family protein [Chitinophagales bacterium]
MKHLPNLLTLANLVSGCIAIAFILNAQPFVSSFNDNEYWVIGTEQAYMGALFILLAAVFDMLDGLAARALQVFSPIGKDLDSLADVVSFGVAPSMILFKMLWASYMAEPYALDVNMFAMVPAFIIACAAAVRLAKFNQSSAEQKTHFIGMPTPAVGLFIASFPLINWYNPFGMGMYLQNKWVIYIIIVLFSWLMLSKIRFFKLMPSGFSIAAIWPQLILIVAGIAGWFVLHIAIIPVIFLLYILLSFIHKPSEV